MQPHLANDNLCIAHSTKKNYKKIKHAKVKGKQESKNKLQVLKKLFKRVRRNRASLTEQISKYADKKASHFVSIRKIKSKDPFNVLFSKNEGMRKQSKTLVETKSQFECTHLLNLEELFHKCHGVTITDPRQLVPHSSLMGSNGSFKIKVQPTAEIEDIKVLADN